MERGCPSLLTPQLAPGFFHPEPPEIHSNFSGPGLGVVGFTVDLSQVIIGSRICHLHNERKMNLSSAPA